MTLPNWKPAKGSGWLASKARSAERKAAEKRVMDEARQRDKAQRGGCAWPQCEYMPKKPRLEVAHEKHRSMGGNPTGDRTTRQTLLTYCFIHHGEYDRGEIDHQPMGPDGTDGPLAFFKRSESGQMECIAVESRIGVSEMRGR